MTVRELIARLAVRDPDLTVVVNDSEFGRFVADDIESDAETLGLTGSEVYYTRRELQEQERRALRNAILDARYATHDVTLIDDVSVGPPFCRPECRRCGVTGRNLYAIDCHWRVP